LIGLPAIDVIIVSLFMQDQDDELRPEQTSRATAVNSSSNWRRTAIAIVITALVTGASGYLVGIRTNQNTSQSTQRVSFQPSPTTIPSSPSVLSISPTPATEAVSWKTYTDTDYGYQANYPQEFTSRKMGVNILFGSKSVGISMYRLLSKNANPNRETVDIPWFGNYLAGSYGGYLKSVGSFPKLTLNRNPRDWHRRLYLIHR
jgi:hypothetical protein